MFNLGGEGQVYAGGLAATAVCLAMPAAAGAVGSSIGPFRRRPYRRPNRRSVGVLQDEVEDR